MNLKELCDCVNSCLPKKIKKIIYNDIDVQLEFANHGGEKITLNASEIRHRKGRFENKYCYRYSLLYKSQSNFSTNVKKVRHILKCKYFPIDSGLNVKFKRVRYDLDIRHWGLSGWSGSLLNYEINLYFEVK